MHLDRSVDDGRGSSRCRGLHHGDEFLGCPVALCVDGPSGAVAERANLFDLQARLRDLLLNDTLFGQGFPECHPVPRPLDHEREGTLGRTERPHAVVDKPGPSRAWAAENPPPSSPKRFSTGTRT